MKRALGRIAFVGTIAVTACAVGVTVGHWLPKNWGTGLGAGLATLAINLGNRWFTWLWPKPKMGWAE
jgi:hypothetical protein